MILPNENQVLPIEVKAGTAGKIKSLHQFVKEKKKTTAIRFNSDLPRMSAIAVQDSFGSSIEYTLLSLTFYLLGQLYRLIKSAEEG